jgi:hypothetical protein
MSDQWRVVTEFDGVGCETTYDSWAEVLADLANHSEIADKITIEHEVPNAGSEETKS